MKRNDRYSGYLLADLIALPQLQEMQESFAEVANVSIRTLDSSGEFVTVMSSPPSLCTEIFSNQSVKSEICDHCRPSFLGGRGLVDEEMSFECLPGLRNYLVPLRLTVSEGVSKILGYMMIGPVIFMKRRDKEDYREIADKLGVPLEQFWSYVLELRVFSYKGIQSFLEMIGHLMNHILSLAFNARSIEREMTNRLKMHTRANREQAVQVREFLQIFLELIKEITGATRSSVMLLDSGKGVLSIKASFGIPEDVAGSVSLKMGEGIAGLSAESKKPFLITEESRDPGIQERLSQPALSSSMVVPIASGENVYGVLNVSRDRAAARSFNEFDLSVATKAAGLAAVALGRQIPS
ncbi:MAG: PocR ligand-binding domain-containing protein [Candidatus Omnitrophota bacterium]